MTDKIKRWLVLLVLAAALLAVGLVFIGMQGTFGLYGNLQEGGGIRYKMQESDESYSARDGMLLFAYDSGAAADFPGEYSGVFTAQMRPRNYNGSPDLRSFTMYFTDTETGDSFGVGVSDDGAYRNVYVTCGGEKAGIYYYSAGTATGYTAAYNREGSYTRISSAEGVDLRFDPATMQVSVLGDSGSYILVWDFSQEYNDGKRLTNDLEAFGDYTVRFVFDEIKNNGKGELLVYSLGGYVFDGAELGGEPNVKADFAMHAVVGQEYELPAARAFTLTDGALPADRIAVTVYDKYGTVLNEDGQSRFTPAYAGEYYIYYEYNDGTAGAGAYYAVTAFEQSAVTQRFVYDRDFKLPERAGVHAEVYIPAASVESNLSFNGGRAQVPVSIQKDGAPVGGYVGVPGGFTYTFAGAGTYEIIYETSVYGIPMRVSDTIVIDASLLSASAEELPQIVEYMSTLTVEPATVYAGGTAHEAQTSVLYPSGKTAGAGDLLLDELGIYTVYRLYEGEVVAEQTFTVKQSYNEMFEGAFSSAAYGEMESNNSVKGVVATLTNGDVLTYNKLIDLSDNVFDDTLDDKTQNTPLVELYLQPETVGIPDLSALYITLTDKYDANNYNIIRIKYLEYLPQNMRVRTMAAGQSWVGYDYDFYTGEISVDSAQSHEDGGAIFNLNPGHAITSRQFTDCSMKLYFDFQKGCLYGQTWQKTAGNSTAENPIYIPWLIRDYMTSDSKLSAGDTPWKGFTTGEVYFSMYAVGVSSTAKVVLTNIDGENLSQRYVEDSQAPAIEINAGDSLPLAQVGKPYPLFAFTAVDSYSLVAKTDVTVSHLGETVAVEEEAFVPFEVGSYVITYTAVDAFGNKAEESVTVEARNSLPPLTLQIEEFSLHPVVGERITLPRATAEGGSGRAEVAATVRSMNTGEELPVENNRLVCEEAGDYLLIYTAVDYIGDTVTEYVYIYDVSEEQCIVFDENSLSLPDAFIDGDPFVFPPVTADYFDGKGNIAPIEAKIYVTDASGAEIAVGGAYVPAASDSVTQATVRFVFEAGGLRQEAERTVPIRTIRPGYGFLAQYFSVENGSAAARDGAVILRGEAGEDMSFSFIRPLNERYLSVGFLRGSFGRMEVTLQSVSDADKSVRFTVTDAGGVYTFSAGSASVPVRFNEEGEFLFRLDRSTHRLTDIFGTEIGTVSQFENGETFTGFGGDVYMRVTVYGDTPEVGITSISNQDFNNIVRDTVAPRISLDGTISGAYQPGDAVTLPTASAYDVLNAVGDITISVLAPDGSECFTGVADRENTFTVSEFGTYSIIYTATDAAGNTLRLSNSVLVYDDVPPSLVLNGEIPQIANRGDTLALPSYEIQDNGDVSAVQVRIYLAGPDGMEHELSGNAVTFSQKGVYTLSYLLVDENGNVAVYAYHISAA